jgi:hypothetical protein
MEPMKSSEDLFKKIDEIVRNKNLDYFEAVLLYCEKNNLEVEVAASLIKQNPILKAKIQLAAEDLNMIKKTFRLPV